MNQKLIWPVVGKEWTNTKAPHSLNITPLFFFFFWGYIEDRVFVTLVHDVETWKVRITVDVSSVIKQMLDNTYPEFENRFDILRATKGAHVKLYDGNWRQFTKLNKCLIFFLQYIFVIREGLYVHPIYHKFHDLMHSQPFLENHFSLLFI